MRSDVTVISWSNVDAEANATAVLEYPSAAIACSACTGEQETPRMSAPAMAGRAADVLNGCSHAGVDALSCYEERVRLDARGKHFFANCTRRDAKDPGELVVRM